MYTHTLTKIGTSYMLKDNKNPQARPLVFKDFQTIEPSLKRKGCWETTQGTDLIPQPPKEKPD